MLNGLISRHCIYRGEVEGKSFIGDEMEIIITLISLCVKVTGVICVTQLVTIRQDPRGSSIMYSCLPRAKNCLNVISIFCTRASCAKYGNNSGNSWLSIPTGLPTHLPHIYHKVKLSILSSWFSVGIFYWHACSFVCPSVHLSNCLPAVPFIHHFISPLVIFSYMSVCMSVCLTS